jgi:hypothetical protein
MTNLSPSAQAVLNALLEAKFGKEAVELGFPVMSVILGRELAAAIRALAYNVYSDEYVTCGGSSYALMIDMDDILAIAAELEAQ